MRPPIGLYVHIPFCVRKCHYCDFYSLPMEDGLADDYTAAVIRAMKTRPGEAPQADTLYLGGGTPSLMGHQRLARIVEAARKHVHLPSDGEITLEANPGTLDLEELKALQKAGFNRISFGVQTLEDSQLARLGRIHRAADAVKALEQAHDAGFRQISADLMLGIPGQTRESLRRDLSLLTALPLTHISAYMLKVEEGTLFGKQGMERHCPGDEKTAQLYLDCVDFLEQAGFLHYEISNFARPGHECRHNLKYWRCEEYLGIGPAAHSFFGGKRFAFPRDLAAFCAAQHPFALAESQGEGGDFTEYAMLRLRLREGLDVKAAEERFGTDLRPLLQKAAPLEREGYLRINGHCLSMTARGWLISNAIIAHLLV